MTRLARPTHFLYLTVLATLVPALAMSTTCDTRLTGYRADLRICNSRYQTCENNLVGVLIAKDVCDMNLGDVESQIAEEKLRSICTGCLIGATNTCMYFGSRDWNSCVALGDDARRKCMNTKSCQPLYLAERKIVFY